VRSLKVRRPAVLAVLTRLHTDLYRYENGEFSEPTKLHAEGSPAEAADVGVSKRASMASGVRGSTRTDYVKRAQDEDVRRHRKHLQETLLEMAGEDGVVVLGGTQKAISAVRTDLEGALGGRLAEAPELAFDTAREELIAHVQAAVSRLTEDRQAAFLEDCSNPRRGSHGWNDTYRALAAGAVDRLLIARSMIATVPDDAERLVRLALAQGAEVEEVGGDLDGRLMKEAGGVVARLRFVPASLQA
jgi:stalled ribosome rescue protein Dom34